MNSCKNAVFSDIAIYRNIYKLVVILEPINVDAALQILELPQYADDGNAKWYCSRWFYWSVLERLARAAGGVPATEIRGAANPMYFGYPVEITQVMPGSDANSQFLCIFGNLAKAATFGDRRETTISVSDQAYWANDQVGIRGDERIDIVVHSVGDGTNAGPVVGLRAAAS